MSRYHQNPNKTTPIFSSRNTSSMPSMRRIKVFGLLIVMAIITLLFYTNSGRSDLESRQTGDFFQKTKSALDKSSVGGGASTAGKAKVVVGTGNEDDKEASKARLKAAAQAAKDNANMKAPKPDPPSKVVGVGSAAEGAEKTVAGRKKFGSGGEAQEPIKEEEKKGDDDLDVEAEFNSILKKSPIIIYSKSYCPHSKRAKNILLEKYLIEPKPYVVELDSHKLGLQLQAKLADLTGRRTVPNVLINGRSIGGGDDVAELDSTGKLIDKIKDLGGKRMAEVKLRPAVEEKKEAVKEKAVDEHEGHEGHGL